MAAKIIIRRKVSKGKKCNCCPFFFNSGARP